MDPAHNTKALEWRECVQKLRTEMEFVIWLDENASPGKRKAIEKAIEHGDFGAFEKRLRTFLTTCWNHVETEFVRPCIQELLPGCRSQEQRLTGAMTFFPRFGPAGSIAAFINWDNAKHEINSGWPQVCKHGNNREQCPYSRDASGECPTELCVARFLEKMNFSCSRLIERRLPRKSSLEIDLGRLASIASRGDFELLASRAFQSLHALEWRLRSDTKNNVVLIKNGKWAHLRVVWSVLREALEADCAEAFQPFLCSLYSQFKDNYLVRHPDNVAALEGNRTEGKKGGDEKRYSVSSFVQLALSQLIVANATRFYLFHFGPTRQEAGDVGTGTLVLNTYLLQPPYQLPERVWSGISLLLGEAMASIGRWEAVQLYRLHERAKLNLELASTAYVVGHELKDPLGLARSSIDALRESLASAHGVSPGAGLAKDCDTARMFVEAAADLTQNMNLLGSLLQVNRDLGRLDPKFFAEPGRPYYVAQRLAKVTKMLNDLDLPIQVLGLENPKVANLRLASTIRTKDGERRLFDVFFDSILFEIVFNAARRRVESLEVGVGRVRDSDLDEYVNCITFENRMHQMSGANMDFLSEKYARWPTDSETQGGFRHMATKLEITEQGVLYGKRSKRRGEWYFAVALWLKALCLKECS